MFCSGWTMAVRSAGIELINPRSVLGLELSAIAPAMWLSRQGNVNPGSGRRFSTAVLYTGRRRFETKLSGTITSRVFASERHAGVDLDPLQYRVAIPCRWIDQLGENRDEVQVHAIPW